MKNFLTSKIEDRAQFLKYIAAIKKYENLILKRERSILYGEPEIEAYNHFKKKKSTKGKKPSISEKSALKKINALRNKKLKYALRLQMKSGLRISEIADLTKNDLSFNNGKIQIIVEHGKGDKKRKVNVIEDEYLYKNLSEYIKSHDGDKLFYSYSYLMKKTGEYGIESHDLRRLNANKRFDIELDKGKKVREAKQVVQKELGHESTQVTDLYITKRRDK